MQTVFENKYNERPSESKKGKYNGQCKRTHVVITKDTSVSPVCSNNFCLNLCTVPSKVPWNNLHHIVTWFRNACCVLLIIIFDRDGVHSLTKGYFVMYNTCTGLWYIYIYVPVLLGLPTTGTCIPERSHHMYL